MAVGKIGTENRDSHGTATYLSIGNRTSGRNAGTGSGTGQTTYRANALNQYDTNTLDTPTSGQGHFYDLDGNLTQTFIAADIDGDTEVGLDDLSIMSSVFGLTCEDSLPSGVTVEMFDRADFDGDCEIDLDDWSAFMSQYGASGDLSLHAKFTWDGENRLTRAEPVSPGSGSKRIDFKPGRVHPLMHHLRL